MSITAERPIPDGRLTEADPRLKDADPETMRRAAVEMFRERKRAPKPPERPQGVFSPPPPHPAPVAPEPTPAPLRLAEAPSAAGRFSRASLYAPLRYRSEEYTMPTGEKVWVHPSSLAERIDLNVQVTDELFAIGYDKIPAGVSVAQQSERERVQRLLRGWVWQVIDCVRHGPEPDSARVFLPEDADALRSNPGWAEAVEEIAGLSNSLFKGESEAALLRRGLADFFEQQEAFGQRLLSDWNASCGATSCQACRKALVAFVSSISSLRRSETLASDLQAFRPE